MVMASIRLAASTRIIPIQSARQATSATAAGSSIGNWRGHRSPTELSRLSMTPHPARTGRERSPYL